MKTKLIYAHHLATLLRGSLLNNSLKTYIDGFVKFRFIPNGH